MKRGFTLLELQTSVFLGLLVVAVCGTVLTFEVQRGVAVQDRAALRKAAAMIDGHIQWHLFQADMVVLEGSSIRIQSPGGIFSADARGFWDQGRALDLPDVSAVCNEIALDGVLLSLNVTLTGSEETEDVLLHYVLGQRVEVRE